MNIVPIVFAFDNNLTFPACICISSLMMNANADTFYDIFILNSKKDNIDRKQLDKIPFYYNNCRIQYRYVDNTFDSSFEIRGITTSAYYRLLIPELIPEYDKIIYSDVDVIFRSDLFSIFNSTNLKGYYFAGVNSLSYLIPEYNEYYKKIGLDSFKIIYSGNLIINSKDILNDGIITEFKKHANKNYKFQDMDIINIVCRDKIKYLPPEFCLTTFISQWLVYDIKKLYNMWSKDEIEKTKKNGLIHYNGQKPWKGYCVNFDIWWEYYRKSPFFDEKFYFDFFYSRLNELDRLSLWKRVKILIRYFVYGKRNI